MTQLPPPPIPHYRSPRQPRAPRRPWTPRELLAWLLILLAVAAMFTSAALTKQRSAGGDNVQMEYIARYVIGTKVAFASVPTMAGKSAELMAAVDQYAKSPRDQLRAAIVSAELIDRTEALTRIAALRTAPAAESAGKKSAAATAASAAFQDDLDVLSACYSEGFAQYDAKKRAAFEDRYQWFARLAESSGLPESSPARHAAIMPAIRTIVTVLCLALLMIGGFIVGLALLIIGLVFVALRKMPLAFAQANAALPRPVRSTYLEGFALYLASYIGLSLLLRYGLHVESLWTALVLPLAFAAGLLWPLLRGQSPAQWRAALGLHAPRGIAREMFFGALGYLAGLPVFAVGVIITLILTKLSGADTAHPIVNAVRAGWGLKILLIILAVVWAPITEELMFRGALFGHLRERFGWFTSALLVAVLFAAIHPQGWAAIPALAALAVVLAGIREWRGSIVGSMTAHAINNAVALTVLFLVMG